MATNGTRGVPEASGSPRQEEPKVPTYSAAKLGQFLQFFGDRFTEYALQFQGAEVDKDLAHVRATVEVVSKRLTMDAAQVADAEHDAACDSAEAWQAQAADRQEEVDRLNFLLGEKDASIQALDTKSAELEGVIEGLRGQLHAASDASTRQTLANQPIMA